MSQSNCIKQALNIPKLEFICSPKPAPFPLFLASVESPATQRPKPGRDPGPTLAPPGASDQRWILGQLRLPLAFPRLTGDSQHSLESAALLGGPLLLPGLLPHLASFQLLPLGPLTPT